MDGEGEARWFGEVLGEFFEGDESVCGDYVCLFFFLYIYLFASFVSPPPTSFFDSDSFGCRFFFHGGKREKGKGEKMMERRKMEVKYVRERERERERKYFEDETNDEQRVNVEEFLFLFFLFQKEKNQQS